MNIKANRRNYAKGGRVKGYVEGGTIWADPTSQFSSSLPISGGSAGVPGGYTQTGGPGVYDPEEPQSGAQQFEIDPTGRLARRLRRQASQMKEMGILEGEE